MLSEVSKRLASILLWPILPTTTCVFALFYTSKSPYTYSLYRDPTRHLQMYCSRQKKAATQFPDDVLPPGGEHCSREALHEAINAWVAARGYAFVTGKSKESANGRRIVFSSCDRGGRRPDASAPRTRLTTSMWEGCLFSILAKESLDKSVWQLTHRPGKEHSHHNHRPSVTNPAHPVHRQLSKLVSTERATIKNLAKAGIAPKDIRSSIA